MEWHYKVDAIPEQHLTIIEEPNNKKRHLDEIEEIKEQEDDQIPVNTFCAYEQKQPTKDDALNCTVLKPDELKQPTQEGIINHQNTPHFSCYCFPTLFPYGIGCPFSELAPNDNTSLRKRIQHLIWYTDLDDNEKPVFRFSRHRSYIYWLYSHLLRIESLTDINFSIHTSQLDHKYTQEELNKMILDDHPAIKNFIKQSTRDTVGSQAYWVQTRKNLQSLMQQLGKPSIFFTQSSADTKNCILKKLLYSSTNQSMDVANNPHICALMFMETFNLIYEKLFKKIFNAKWVWVRFEFQNRGSIHLHGFARLDEPKPGLENISKLLKTNQLHLDRQKGILEEYKSSQSSYQNYLAMGSTLKRIDSLAKIKRKYEKILTDFNDYLGICCSLQRTFNNGYDPSSLLIKPAETVFEGWNFVDYTNLANSVNYHEHSPYCLRNDKCRFNFPKGPQDKTNIKYEKGKKENTEGQYFLTCEPTRNNISDKINQHCVCHLIIARANVDMKLMVDNKMSETYITKYCCKSEMDSEFLSFIKRQIVNNADNKTAFQKLSKLNMKIQSKRDYSSQEVFFLLVNDGNNNNLYQTDTQSMFINLNERYKVKNKYKPDYEQADENGQYLDKNVRLFRQRRSFNVNNKARNITVQYNDWQRLQKFFSQNNCQEFLTELDNLEQCQFTEAQMNKDIFELPMVEFYKRFSIDEKAKRISENIKYKNRKVVICSPSYRWADDHENFSNYCKYQLFKWNSEENGETPLNCEDEKEYWINKWHRFKENNYNTVYHQLHEEMQETGYAKLKRAEESEEEQFQELGIDIYDDFNYVEERQYDNFEDCDEDLEENLFPQVQSKDQDIQALQTRINDIQKSKEEEFIKYRDDMFAKYSEHIPEIKNWVATQKKNQVLSTNYEYEVIDKESLTNQQKVFYRTILRGVEFKQQQLIILLGQAGSGKSHCIKLIRSILKEKLRVAAYTAQAGYLIGGDTIHGLIGSFGKSQGFKCPDQLAGVQLQKLQEEFKNVTHVVFDEFSMLNFEIMHYINIRLQQAKDNFEQYFGGMSLILAGDFFQLPPIEDPPLFSLQKKMNSKCLNGKGIYKSFDIVIQLTKIQRIDHSNPYLEKWTHLLNGLRNQILDDNDRELIKSRRSENLANQEINSFDGTKTIMQKNKEIKKYHFQRLLEQQKMVFCINSQVSESLVLDHRDSLYSRIGTQLLVTIGSNTILRQNIWKQAGMFNGAKCTVREILYDKDANLNSLPICIFVEFDEFKGVGFRESNLVPLVPQTFPNQENSKLYRKQIPIELADAVTVYRIQGSQLNKGQINLKSKDKKFGESYIAFSRFRKAQDLIIHPYIEDRFDFSDTSQTLKDIKRESIRLQNISITYLKKFIQSETSQEYVNSAIDVLEQLKKQ